MGDSLGASMGSELRSANNGSVPLFLHAASPNMVYWACLLHTHVESSELLHAH